MDDPQWLTVAEDIFAHTDAIVLTAFQVTKRVHNSDATGQQLLQALGGQARRRKDFEPRLLCFTVKRSQADREFKGSLHMCKKADQGNSYQVSKSWPLRYIAHIITGSRKTELGVMKCARVTIAAHSGQPEHIVEYGFFATDLLMYFLALVIRLLRRQEVEPPSLTGVAEDSVQAWWEANGTKARPLMTEFSMELLTEGGTESKKEGSSVLVSAKEEKDLEQLLDMFAMGIGDVEEFESRLTDEHSALEAANVHAMLESTGLVDNVLFQLRRSQTILEDMDESLKVFDFKLRTMREDIAAIEASNNKLELQARNNAKLLSTVEGLINDLNLPLDALRMLSEPDFHPENMSTVIAAARLLHERLQKLDSEATRDSFSPLLMNLSVVRETQKELQGLNQKFVGECKRYLEEMLSMVANQQLNEFDRMQGGVRLTSHEMIRNVCERHKDMLRVMRDLDATTLASLQLFYCQNMNRLYRKEVRTVILEMKKSVGADRHPPHKAGGEGGDDEVMFVEGDFQLHEAFAMMLDSVIPFLLDELDFAARFLLLYREDNWGKRLSDSSRRGTLDPDGDLRTQLPPIQTGRPSLHGKELNSQGRSLMEVLLKGVDTELMVPVELTARGNQIVTIPMIALTNKWLGKLAGMSIAEFLTKALSMCMDQLDINFKAYIKQQEANITKFDNRPTVAFASRSGEGAVKNLKVLPFISQFAILANHMEVMLAESIEPTSPLATGRLSPTVKHSPSRREREQRVLGRQLSELEQAVTEEARNQIRAEVDGVYKSLIEAMFATLERLAQTDPKHGYRLRLENYTYFIDSVRPLVQHVPSLKAFLTRAETIQEECMSHYVQQQLEYGKLWKLLDLSERIDKLLKVVSPSEVAFQMSCSAGEVRSMLKDTMSGADKKLSSMHVRVKKHLAGNNSLTMRVWQALQLDLISRYTRLEQQVAMCYPSVVFKPTSDDLRELFRNCT